MQGDQKEFANGKRIWLLRNIYGSQHNRWEFDPQLELAKENNFSYNQRLVTKSVMSRLGP